MVGQRIGYIRVSTIDQNVERQLEGIALDRTFIDKASGKDTKWPQLDLLMSYARDGDTVVVHSMDRLAHKPRAAGMRPLVVRFPGEDISRLRLLANSRSQTLSALLREILAAYCRQLQHDCALTKPPLWHDVM